MRNINSTKRWGCLGPKTGATHYHAQLELPDKDRTIKGFVVIVCCSTAKINDLWGMGLWTSAGAWSGPLLCSGWLSSTDTLHIFINPRLWHNW